MIHKRRVLELSIEELEIRETGARGTGRHFVVASLVYPRPAIAAKTVVKEVAFEDRAAVFGSAEWTDRVLFKETVHGPFGLRVEVTAALNEGQVSRFMKFLGGALFKIAASEADALADGLPALAVAGLPMTYVSKYLSGKGENRPSTIAVGVTDMVVGPDWDPGHTMHVTVPLTAPSAVTRVVRIRTCCGARAGAGG